VEFDIFHLAFLEDIDFRRSSAIFVPFSVYMANFGKRKLMKGVSFVTEETHKRRYAQIDLKGIAAFDDEQMEDLMDIIIAEARKDEKSMPWETVKAELIKEGKII
jgi:hypothetical protein